MDKESFVDRMMKDVATKPHEADQIEATKQIMRDMGGQQ
jgi:hypothetical protein